MRRVVVFALAVVVVYALPASAAPRSDWWFKTPGGAAYCGSEVGRFLCVRPADGFWFRFTNVFGTHADVRKGRSNDFRGLREPAPRLLGIGEVFYSSDAAVITCRSRRTGLTCKHFEGLSFSIGRARGHRIFYEASGFPPNVQPLFKTSIGIHCGIDADNLEPSQPFLTCWRSTDGVVLGILHGGGSRRGTHSRIEKAIDFRPRGFRLLGQDRTFEWRCRNVTALRAERCSMREGTAVFTCTNTHARLTCSNRRGHGFWASARSFYTF